VERVLRNRRDHIDEAVREQRHFEMVSPKSLFRSFGGGSKKEDAKHSPESGAAGGAGGAGAAGDVNLTPPASQPGLQARLQRQRSTPPLSSPGMRPGAQQAVRGSVGQPGQPAQFRPPPAQKSNSMPQMPLQYPQQKQVKKQMIVWPVELVRQHLPDWAPPLVGKHENGEEKAVSPPEEDGWLGIEFQPRVDGHLVITKIVEGGPASGTKSVMVGDVIVGIRGFFARALTPMQIKELTKGYAGTKLQLTLGSEFERGKSYTTEHHLYGGGTIKVSRVKVVSLNDTAPTCMEPESQLLTSTTCDESGELDESPPRHAHGVSSLAGMDSGDHELLTADEELEQKEMSEAVTTALSVNDDCTEDAASSTEDHGAEEHDTPDDESPPPQQ